MATNIIHPAIGINTVPDSPWAGQTIAAHTAVTDSRVFGVVPRVQIFNINNGVGVKLSGDFDFKKGEVVDIYAFPSMKDAVEFLYSRLAAERMGVDSAGFSAELHPLHKP